MDTAAPLVSPAPEEATRLDFEGLYDQSFELVWRLLRRLGVPEGALEDAVQDVFLIVHRRLGEFQGRSSPRTWVAGIAIRVAADHRRYLRRKGGLAPLESEVPAARHDPHLAAEQAEGVRQLHEALGEMDEAHREVFVLAELEQLTAPEISEALGVKPNTVYSRLRSARKTFERFLERTRRLER